MWYLVLIMLIHMNKILSNLYRHHKMLYNYQILCPIGYTDDMLANLSNIMTTALNDAGEKYNSFVESLTSCYNTVVQNRSELSPQGAPEEEQPEEEVVVPEYDPASEEESEEE